MAPRRVPGTRASVSSSTGWGHVLQDPPSAVSEAPGAGARAALLSALEGDGFVRAVEPLAGQSAHGAGAGGAGFPEAAGHSHRGPASCLR